MTIKQRRAELLLQQHWLVKAYSLKGRILVGFEDYKYGLKNTMYFILKIQLRAVKDE